MKTKKKKFKWSLNKHLLVSDNLPCVDLYSAIRAQRDIKNPKCNKWVELIQRGLPHQSDPQVVSHQHPTAYDQCITTTFRYHKIPSITQEHGAFAMCIPCLHDTAYHIEVLKWCISSPAKKTLKDPQIQYLFLKKFWQVIQFDLVGSTG